MDFEKFCFAIAAIFGVPFALLSAYVIAIGVPVMMYTEAECLRNGYPKYKVSIGLERYCLNLDGTITVKVDKAKDLRK